MTVWEYRSTLSAIWLVAVIALFAMGVAGEMWVSAIGIVASTLLLGWFWE